MSHKTNAYSEGYTAAQGWGRGVTHNPYDEVEEYEKYSEWKNGYIDGLTNKETGSAQGVDHIDLDEDVFESYDEDEEEEDDNEIMR